MGEATEGEAHDEKAIREPQVCGLSVYGWSRRSEEYIGEI
jgi:hypothetical protein